MNNHTRTNGDAGEVTEVMRDAAVKLRKDLKRTARDTREAADALGSALRHSARDVADQARTSAKDATRTMKRSVRKHPIALFGAAAGAGALISFVLMSRTRGS
jgi:ElaB/YqjD/DUF883 family membrane-anchored ribosome-binding protein